MRPLNQNSEIDKILANVQKETSIFTQNLTRKMDRLKDKPFEERSSSLPKIERAYNSERKIPLK